MLLFIFHIQASGHLQIRRANKWTNKWFNITCRMEILSNANHHCNTHAYAVDSNGIDCDRGLSHTRLAGDE